MYNGTIIENSLKDKSILDKVKVEKTYHDDDWILHDVLIREDQISELSHYLDDGPWYIHLWESGKDDVIVVFKDKVCAIKYSDKNTWKDAVAHGKSIGIPDQHLDFAVE